EGLRPEPEPVADVPADLVSGDPADDRPGRASVSEPVGAEPDDNRLLENPGAGRRLRTACGYRRGAAARGIVDDRVVEELTAAQEPRRQRRGEPLAFHAQRQLAKARVRVGPKVERSRRRRLDPDPVDEAVARGDKAAEGLLPPGGEGRVRTCRRRDRAEVADEGVLGCVIG